MSCAAIFGLRAAQRTQDPLTDGVHAVMAVGMSTMCAPFLRVPGTVGATVFAAIGAACLASGLMRARPLPVAAHLVLTCGAMAYMWSGTHDASGTGPLVHHHTDSVSGSPQVAPVFVTLGFVGYFGAHAATWLTRGVRTWSTAPCRGALVVRAQPATHVVMSGLMVAMFLATV